MELPSKTNRMRYLFVKIGLFKIVSPSPANAGNNYYTITFNRLENVTNRYRPAIGFVDLKYQFSNVTLGPVVCISDQTPT